MKRYLASLDWDFFDDALLTALLWLLIVGILSILAADIGLSTFIYMADSASLALLLWERVKRPQPPPDPYFRGARPEECEP